MSHTTRTHNSGQDTDQRRNNPSQYNLRPLLPQVEEHEGDELIGKRMEARRQSLHETRAECLEHCFDTLTELVSTQVTALGQNAANMALAILLGMLSLPKRVGMPWPVMQKLRPTCVEGTLGAGTRILVDQLKRTASPPQSLTKLYGLVIQSSMDLNDKQSTSTWTITTTPSLITPLAQGELLI